MRRFSAGDILLKALGLLLLTAAVLKGHELLTAPVANKDLWSWRPFLIFQVEFELGLGIWLLSGVFKRLVWLTAVTCFGLFCCITLCKGLTGAASCGCFGRVHVNPWITLTAIDLPAVISLSLFRPVCLLAPLLSFLRSRLSAGIRDRASIRHAVAEFAKPLPSLPRFTATAVLCVAILGLTAPILALNKPAVVTSTYEVLEPETWVGQELPILEYIDIAERLTPGTWLLLFYHYDCPDCQKAIPQYEQMARDLSGNEDFFRVASVEVPPYGPSPLRGDSGYYALGRLADVKDWFVTTPVTCLIAAGRVRAVWQDKAPDLGAVLAEIAECERRTAKSLDLRIYIDPVRNALY